MKHWQISFAVLFSTVLVTGAYVITQTVITPQVAQASAETALLQAIATKDSDKDGLPDWQESLYGTDPQNADSFKLGMTDGDAVARGLIVPKAITDLPSGTSSTNPSPVDSLNPSLPPAPADSTLTAQFAQTFLSLYLSARQANGGQDLSETQLSDIANQSVETLAASIQPTPDFKSLSDLNVVGSGPDAMNAFAASAEAVLLKNTNDATTTDIAYLHSALIDGNDSAYAKIASIAKGYRGSAAGLAALPVPQELAEADLLLINTLMRMSELDIDFTRVNEDPLAAILALQQYQTVATALAQVFLDIGNAYASANLSLPAGAPGALFVNMTADVQRKQAAKKP
jgi:hypothetical protein